MRALLLASAAAAACLLVAAFGASRSAVGLVFVVKAVGVPNVAKAADPKPDPVRVLLVGDSITAGSCCCPEVKGIGYSKALRKALLAKTAKLGFGDEHHPVYEFVMEAGSGVRAMMPDDPKCSTAERHDHDGDGAAARPTIWHADKWDSGQDNHTPAKALDKAAILHWKREQIALQNPDVVLLMLGSNDAYSNWRECRAKFAEDYASLIDIYHSMPTPPRIVIMMPPHLYSSKHWQDLGQSGYHDYTIDKHVCSASVDEVAAYCDKEEDACAKTGNCDQLRACIVKCVVPPIIQSVATARTIDTISFDMADDMIAPDGLHPTCGGHDLIAQVLADKAFTDEHITSDMLNKQEKITADKTRGFPVDGWKTNKWMKNAHSCNKDNNGAKCPGPFCGTRGILC